jgi:hypothetical protein
MSSKVRVLVGMLVAGIGERWRELDRGWRAFVGVFLDVCVL